MATFREPAPSDSLTNSNPLPSKNIAILKHLWPYLWKNRGLIALAILAILTASGAVLAFGQGLKGIVDHGLASNDPASLDRAFEIMLAIILTLSFASMARMYAVSAVGERVVADLRKNLFAHLLKLTPGFFEITRTGEILSRLTTDTTQIQTLVGTSFPIALRNGVLLIGTTAMLFWTAAKLTAMVMVVVPIVLVPLIWIGRRVRKLSRKAQDRIADISAYGDEAIGFIKTVQAYTHEALDILQFNARADLALRTALDRAQIRAVLSALIIGLIFSAIAIVLWIGGYDVLAGRMSGGELASFVFYAIVLAGSVAALSEVISDVQRAAGSLERIMELLQTQPLITVRADPLPLAITSNTSEPLIVFDQVDFHYPSRPLQQSIHGLSLQIPAGQSLGIVGASGAGKTTLFQLLLRFYDPTSGRILFHGLDLRDLDPTILRQRFSYVGQDAAIFSTTLLENIRYGRVDASMDEVRAACAQAKVDEFLPRLPDGLNSYVGEKGARLSGGQKQRIAIARAILRNPEVLLLDEATSQLDSDNERLVQAAVEQLAQGRTILTIAHRLSTLRNADRIIVLENGGLIAEGKHESLIEHSETYRHLAQLQKAG